MAVDHYKTVGELKEKGKGNGEEILKGIGRGRNLCVR
jgi:hypothetical protein